MTITGSFSAMKGFTDANLAGVQENCNLPTSDLSVVVPRTVYNICRLFDMPNLLSKVPSSKDPPATVMMLMRYLKYFSVSTQITCVSTMLL